MESQLYDSTSPEYGVWNETLDNDTLVVPPSFIGSFDLATTLGLDWFRKNQLYVHLFYAILGLLGAFGISGNVLSFIIFHRNSRKTPTSFLLKALAIASICTLLTFIPCSCLLVHLLLKDDFFWLSIVTLFVYPVTQVALLLVTWVTVLIAAARFIAICYPLRASTMCTATNIARSLLIAVVYAILLQVPNYIAYRVKDVEIGNSTYTVMVLTSIGAHPLFTLIYMGLYLVCEDIVPFVIMCVLTTKIVVSLRHTIKYAAHMRMRQQRHESHVTRVLISILLLFTVCQAVPYIIVIPMVLYSFSLDCFFLLQLIVYPSVITLYASVNFMNYVLLNKNFRSSMLELLCCRKSSLK